MYGVERTGVRFVLSSPSDLERVEDYHAWYDIYPTVVTRLGFLVNCFRFENPAAAGSEEDPRSVAIYDIVTPDSATAWRPRSMTGRQRIAARRSKGLFNPCPGAGGRRQPVGTAETQTGRCGCSVK
jgi:hypothetical protein